MVRFENRNGLIEDPVAEEKERKRKCVWTDRCSSAVTLHSIKTFQLSAFLHCASCPLAPAALRSKGMPSEFDGSCKAH